jgi:adenylate cyclase
MAKKEKFYPIGFKLISTVSAVLVVALGGLTFLSTGFYTDDIERTIRTNTMERVALLSRDIESAIASDVNTGRLISATMSGSSGAGPLSGTTAALLEQNPDFLAVWSLSKDGTALRVGSKASSGPRIAQLGITLPDGLMPLQEHANQFLQAFYGETVLVNAAPELGAPILVLAFPDAMKAANEAETVVLLFMTMDRMTAFLASQELYVNYLVDSKGTLLAHSDGTTALLRPSLSDETIVRDSISGQAKLKQMQYAGKDGKSFIGSYQRFLDGALTVVSAVEKGTALAGVYQLQLRNLVLTLMFLCAAMFLFFFFSKSITDPVKTLVEGVEHIKDGDYTFRMTPTSRDEIGHLTLSFNAMTQGLDERDRMKTAFGKFVNKDIAERVLKGELHLGGENRVAAIFFSDIRSFTAISEKMTPHEVVEFLNEYMTEMVKCVEHHHGVVDKFIGDAIMAVWGVPEEHGNATENAVNAALAMRKALAIFNRKRMTAGLPRVSIGCGINTGDVVAGQIGSLDRMEYTCIGDTVNLASRIESTNKLFHTDILISEASLDLVPLIFRVEPMKPIHVKGKEKPQQIYAVLGRLDDPHHFKSIGALRAFLGVSDVSFDEVDPEAEEQKYEVVK